MTRDAGWPIDPIDPIDGIPSPWEVRVVDPDVTNDAAGTPIPSDPTVEGPVGSAQPRFTGPAHAGDALAILGLALSALSLFLPAVTWTGWQAGTRLVVGYLVGGRAGQVPPADLSPMLTLFPAAALVGVALLARTTGRRILAIASAAASCVLAAVWAGDVASTTVSFQQEEVIGLVFWSDYGVVTIHPWIWCLPIALAVFGTGVALWAGASIVGGRPWCAPTPLQPAEWRRSGGGAPLVLAGLGLWVVAQALPAYTTAPFLDPEGATTFGWQATLVAWDLAVLGGSWTIFVAWTANIWFVLALGLSWRRHVRPALVLALVAAACAAVGLWVLVSGGLPESSWPNAVITEVGIGSWVWFASTAAALAGCVLASLGPVQRIGRRERDVAAAAGLR